MSARDALARTAAGVRLVFRRRDGRVAFAVAGVAYLLVYLAATRALVAGRGRVGVLVADDPLALLFRRRTAFTFEPLARVDLSAVSLLVSPAGLFVAVVLAALVALNLALSYLVWRQPAACGVSSRASGAGAGLVAAAPALLSGSACCAPALLVVLGLQASGLLLAAAEVLVPVSVALLAGSLLLVGRRVDPAAAG